MPRIPYDPTKYGPRAQRQGRVDASGAIRAIGQEAAANRELAGAAQNAVNLGMALRQDKIEEDTFADQQRFESVATEAELDLNKRLESIQVADGVNYRAEAESATENYLGQLRDWVDAGNITHKQKEDLFRRRIAEMETKLKERVGEGEMQFQRQRNIGAGKRGIETGIRLNDPEAIERGVMSLHLAMARGYVSEDEADMMYEKHVRSAKGEADKRTMTTAENLLAEGDVKGFREKVDALELPTQDEKKKIKREHLSSHAYNSAALAVQEAEGLEDLDSVESMIENSKDLTAGNRPVLMRSVNAQRRRIERAQIANERDLLSAFADGEGDWSEFQRRASLDTAEGLTADAEQVLRPVLESLEDEYQASRQLERDQDKVAYRSMLDTLAAERFGETSTGRIDKNTPEGEEITKKRRAKYDELLEQIDNLAVGTRAKAKLLDEWLQVRATDLIEPGKEDPSAAWFNARELSSPEKRIRGEVVNSYRRLLESGDVPEGFGQAVEADDMRIAEFFEQNENPTLEQLKKLRQDVLGPREAETRRRKARGETRENGLPLPGDVVEGYRYRGGDPANPESWEVAE